MDTPGVQLWSLLMTKTMTNNHCSPIDKKPVIIDEGKIELGGIYQIINIKKNRVYIGSAKCFKRRWGQHISKLKHNHHENIFFQNDWNKTGAEYFTFKILEVVQGDKIHRTEREQYYLNVALHDKKCYNIKKIVKDTDGFLSSEARKTKSEKISERLRKVWNDQEYRAKAVKSQNDPSLIKKKSDYMLLLWQNRSHRRRISFKMKEYWKKPENRAAAAARSIGRKHSKETKDYLRMINTGRTVSQKSRKKISDSLKLYYENIDLKNAISERAKRLWENEHYRNNLVEKILKRCCKEITSIDLTGNKTTFASVADAARFYNISESSIRDVLKNRIKKTRNLRFEYSNKISS